MVVGIDSDCRQRGRSLQLSRALATVLRPSLRNCYTPSQYLRMNPDSNVESPDLKKPLPAEVVGSDLPPGSGKETVDAEASVLQPSSSPESRGVSRVGSFFFTISYTAAFAIVTLLLCLHGSQTIGFPYDERSAVFARTTYASIIGSIVLGPVYFTSKRFMTFMKARHEAINIHTANGRLFEALRHPVLLSAVVVGTAASAASLGHGLIFRSLVYSESVPTEKMVIDSVLVPVACLLGGLRWTYEVVSTAMWVLVRIPKISTGLEGDKYDRLMKIAYVPFSFLFVEFLF